MFTRCGSVEVGVPAGHAAVQQGDRREAAGVRAARHVLRAPQRGPLRAAVARLQRHARLRLRQDRAARRT